jgi:hypothetical protein
MTASGCLAVCIAGRFYKRSIVVKILEKLFGCRHDNWSLPFTLKGKTYRVCLECGFEKDYDFGRMEFRHEKRVKGEIVS